MQPLLSFPMLSKPPNASKEMIIGSILRINENGCVVVYGKLTQGKILLRNKSALASPEQSLLNCCTKRKSQNQCYVLYHNNQVHFWTATLLRCCFFIWPGFYAPTSYYCIHFNFIINILFIFHNFILISNINLIENYQGGEALNCLYFVSFDFLHASLREDP